VSGEKEQLTGSYIARAILWIFLAAIVSGAIAFAKDTMDTNAAQNSQIAVIQSQYKDIDKTLDRIERNVAEIRKQQEEKWHLTGRRH